MNYHSLFSIQALKQLDEIILWYEGQSQQATDHFIEDLDRMIQKVCLTPFLYRNLRKDYREIKMKKFPYYIIYRANKNKKEVLILRIYHTSRNPENKYLNI